VGRVATRVGAVVCPGGWVGSVCVMGRHNGCLLSDGEGVWGRIVLTFFLTRLVSWRLGGF